MASRNFFVEGLDLTGLGADATNAQINQAIREAYPATDLGLHIKSEDTPDVATYPEYETFLWTKISTGETKYWDGASWQLIQSQAIIADGTVTIGKLSVSGGAALQLIRVNAGGTAFEFIDVSAIFTTNTIPLDNLVNAPAEGYVVFSGPSGVWTRVLWAAQFELSLSESNIPVSQLRDLDSTGLLDQVLRLDSGGLLTWEYADQLLRSNQVPTDRLQFGAGMAGQYVKVNAGGTDLEPAAAVTSESGAAILKYTALTGVAGQVIPATTETTVEWDAAAVDPGSIVTSIVAHQFTLPTGTYLFDIYIPLSNPGTDTKSVVVLRDVTAANAILATASTVFANDADDSSTTLKHVVKITASSNTYDVRIYADDGIELGSPVTLGTYAETYQQMSITKLA